MLDIWPDQNIPRAQIPAGETIAACFLLRPSPCVADKVALRQKDFGLWREMTWNEMGKTVREIGMGLVALGLEPGDVASILSNTRQEWTIADLCYHQFWWCGQWNLSNRCGCSVRISADRLPLAFRVCRGRGTTRQGAGSPHPNVPSLVENHRL